jgi:hypothetical protein
MSTPLSCSAAKKNVKWKMERKKNPNAVEEL